MTELTHLAEDAEDGAMHAVDYWMLLLDERGAEAEALGELEARFPRIAEAVALIRQAGEAEYQYLTASAHLI